MKYEYGVEYETNGKKPELPDGIEIRVVSHSGNHLTASFPVEVQHDYINWANSKFFVITDGRYKPKSEPAPEQSWFDKGELPPVGVECERRAGHNKWVKTHIIAHHVDGKRAIHCDDGFDLGCLGYSAAVCYRPIKSERERFAEAAIRVTVGTDDIYGALYDAGFRAPEEK